MNAKTIVMILSLVLSLCGCVPTNEKVVLGKDWLETQLGISRLEKTAQSDSLASSFLATLDSMYSTAIVDSFYVDSMNHTRAFEFQITSSCVGIAVIQYDGDRPIAIECFNLFDRSLAHQLRPSFSVLLFNDGKTNYVLDGFGIQLYQHGHSGQLKKLNRGHL
jgi:hypothetical protein